MIDKQLRKRFRDLIEKEIFSQEFHLRNRDIDYVPIMYKIDVWK